MNRNLKKIFWIAALLIFVACGADKSKFVNGVLHVNFQISGPKSDVQPSYQTAVWIEDVQGNLLKTLFVSEYLSYGGYNDSTICPQWSSRANWDAAPEEEYDARTQATPSVGEHDLTFDLSGENVLPGPYFVNIQVHLLEDYNIACSAKMMFGSEAAASAAPVTFSPRQYPGTEIVLSHVRIEFKPSN